MHIVEPKIFIIAEMQVNDKERNKMLTEIGVPEDWDSRGPSDNEELVELSGRLCYKSFGTDLNANITKVREGSKAYIANILKTHHGSVVEHAVTSVAFINVSRIFTHELVRHRQGTAFSQESMRFVRLDDIPMWIPNLTKDFEQLAVFQEDKAASNWVAAMQADLTYAFTRVYQEAEAYIKDYSKFLDRPGVPFSLKKKITSALRRMAPSGHATNIVCTANHRAWRFMIQQRTDRTAEVEIRKVFEMVYKDFVERYPNLYQDVKSCEKIEGFLEVKFENHKI